MDYYADHMYEDSHRHHQEEHPQLSSEYGVETSDNYNNYHNHINVYSAGNQIKHSTDHRDSSSGKLFVGGVSWETTEETFADYFSKYGEIADSVIMMDKHSGRPRGFGFVTFADAMVAEKVLQEDHVIDGRAVEVKRTVPREEMEVKGISKTRKIFVGGLPPSLTEDELKEYFSFYGDIVEHQIMLDHKSGRSRGFGFVTFDTEEMVESIFSEGKTHELGGKQVEIKKAEPKRAGGDYHGSAAKSYRVQGGAGARFGYGDRCDGRTGEGYGGYGGYGGFGGSYDGYSAGYFVGYGGYGYGFGFGGPIYGSGYGVGGYGNTGGYGAATGYNGGKGYGSGAWGGGSYGSGKGYGTNGSLATRYHPYQK